MIDVLLVDKGATVATVGNVSAVANSITNGTRMARQRQPDVILIRDVWGPRGVASCRVFREEAPEAVLLVLARFLPGDEGAAYLRAGVDCVALEEGADVDRLLSAASGVARARRLRRGAVLH